MHVTQYNSKTNEKEPLNGSNGKIKFSLPLKHEC